MGGVPKAMNRNTGRGLFFGSDETSMGGLTPPSSRISAGILVVVWSGMLNRWGGWVMEQILAALRRPMSFRDRNVLGRVASV